MLKKRLVLANSLLYLAVFLLPWQTRYIYNELMLNGGAWEYGKLSFYAVELCILIAATLVFWPKIAIYFQQHIRKAILFLGGVFLSVAFSFFTSLTLAHIVHIIIAVFFFALLLDHTIQTKKVALIFLLSLGIPSLLAWMQALTGYSFASTLLGLASHSAEIPGDAVVELIEGKRILRGYGSFSHPNIFGGYLAIGLLLLLWTFFSKLERQQKKILFLLAPLLTSALILTFSRGAWIAALVGALIFIGGLMIEKRLWPHDAIPTIAIALIGLAVTIGIFYQPFFSRFNPELRLEAKSLSERSSEIALFDDVFLQNPAFGIGPGSYTGALAILFPGSPSYSYQPIHNSYLLMLAEIGVIGSILFGFWIYTFAHAAYKARRSTNGVLAIALLITLGVLALFDHYLFSSWSGLSLLTVTLALIARFSHETVDNA